MKPGAITIVTSPADGGTVSRLDAPCHVRFSKPATQESFSFTVTPDIGSWRLDWSEDRQKVVLEHAKPFEAGTEYSLTVKLAPPREPPVEKTVRFTAYGPASLDLIAEAEKQGTIDLDQAWSYRLQAIFEPSALPAAYQSVTPTMCGTPTLLGLEDVRSRLKPGTADKLDRYLLRPTDPRSIFAERVRVAGRAQRQDTGATTGLLFAQDRPTKTPAANGWFGVDSKLYPITVWSSVSAQACDVAVALIEGKAMYARFKELMPFEPESDVFIQPDNGGDGRLDIYLVPYDPHLKAIAAGGLGATRGLTGGQMTPCFIMIHEGLTGSRLGSVLAHELFHAFQFAIDQREPLWWIEATATWSMDFVEASWNMEHDYVPHAFDKTPHRLITLTSVEGAHPYGAYLFPYYMSSAYGDKIVGDVWTDCVAAGQNALDAVKARLAQKSKAGFSGAFKEFALMNYDDLEAFGPTYPEQLNVFPHHFEHKILLEKDDVGIAFDLPPLSAVYIDVYNHGIDKQKTPSVTFDLDAFKDLPEVGVQAVVMHGKEEEVQDWSGLKEKLFCLNVPEQEFARIVLVVSSTETEETHQALALPVLLRRDPRCDADWMGTLTFTRVFQQSHESSGGTTLHVKESCNISVNAVVRMALKSAAKGDDEIAQLSRKFSELSGVVVYTQDALDGSCTINYEYKLVETRTNARDGPFVLTSIRRASCGSPLIPVGFSALKAPRLSVDSKNGKYTLEVSFRFAKCVGESIVESNRGRRTVNPWDIENLQPLFDSYPLRVKWNEPALGGTFQGDTIRGEWSPPPESSSKSGVRCSLSDLNGAKVTWELQRVKRK